MSDDIQMTAAIRFETDQASASAASKAVEAVTAGANKAADAVNKVKPAAGADKEFPKMSASAERSFGAIDAARQVTEGGMMGLGAAIRNLGSQFPALTAALGPIGLALAAFSAWKKAVDTVVGAHAALETSLRSIRIGNIEAQIKSNAAAYDAYYQSIKRAADESQRLLDIEASKDDANLRSQIAALDLKRAQEKALMNPDDEIGSRKADLSYAEQRAALEDAAAKRKSERDDRAMQAQEAAQTSMSLTAKEQQADAIKSFSDLANERMKIEARIQKASAPPWWSAMGAAGAIIAARTSENRMDSAREKALPDIVKVQTDQQAAVSQLKEAEQKQYSADQAVSSIRSLRDINRTDKKTTDMQYQTRQTDNYNTGTAIDRESGKQLDSLAADINAAAVDTSVSFRNWARQFIEATDRNNGLNAEFMKQILDLTNQAAAQNLAALERAKRL